LGIINLSSSIMSTDDFSLVEEESSFPSRAQVDTPRMNAEVSLGDSWDDWQHHTAYSTPPPEEAPTKLQRIICDDDDEDVLDISCIIAADGLEDAEYVPVLASTASSWSYDYVKTMTASEVADEDSTSTDWEWSSEVASVLTLPSGVWLSSLSDIEYDDEAPHIPPLSYKEVLMRAIAREEQAASRKRPHVDFRQNYKRMTKLSNIPETSVVLESTVNHHQKSDDDSICIQRTRLQHCMKFGRRPRPSGSIMLRRKLADKLISSSSSSSSSRANGNIHTSRHQDISAW
jgi:hypothetical protein